MQFRRKLWCVILVSFCVHLLIACTTELGNDEVYYYTYALHLQWNYFDHPPGVALLIRLSTLNQLLTSEVFVRLGAILCAAAGTWLSYQTGTFIRYERTGFYAAVLYNTSIYASIIAGTFILPDSPQIVFWIGALYLLLQIVVRANAKQHIPPSCWLLFALLSGCCILCKVHGVFIWLGLGLYVLLYERKLLLQPWLYLAFSLTLVLISPIIIWNINNHFITWTFHSSRVAIHQFSINISSFLQAFFGQVFYNNPVNVCLIAVSLFRLPKRPFLRPVFGRLLILTGLPIIVVVTFISLFDQILPHWSGPGFVTLLFIAAAYADSKADNMQQALPLALKSSLQFILLTVVLGLAAIHFYPGTLGSKKIANYGSGDFTLDLSGWKDFEKQYQAWLQQQSKGYQQLKIVCNKWFPAAHLEYYVARPTQMHVVGVGSVLDLHNFVWLNKARSDLKNGENALCIMPSNYTTDVNAAYANYFSSIQKLHSFEVVRSGKTTRYFTVYLLENYHATDEAHTVTVK